MQNGDEVQILTSKAQTAPPAAWESIVVTGKARASIRRATRAAVRNQYSGLGRRIVERLCQRAKIGYSDEQLEGALPRLARASIDDVMSAVGRGEMKAADVVRAMYPDYKDERVTPLAPKAESGWFGLKKAKAVKFKLPGDGENRAAIPIRGINTDLPVRFAPNGGAVPGDRIVGIMTPGEGITIYPIHSEALKQFEDEPERWLDVRWDVDDKVPQRFPARLAVQSVNEPGTLAQIAQVIAEHDGNIDNIKMTQAVAGFYRAGDRPRGLQPQAPHIDHLAATGEKSGRQRRARERISTQTDIGMPALAPIRLGVNIDHVATVRNARGGRHPDPVKAAEIAIAAGADGITAHLREDRRHIVDDDVTRLKDRIAKLNLEMAATREMVEIARKLRPHAACIVPERRQERTTEGGLDAAGQREALRGAVGALSEAGIRVSLFIAAEPAQIEAAVAIGAPVIEIHTGAWCDALAAGDAATGAAEFDRIVRGAALAKRAGLEVHAGHGLDFVTAERIAQLPEIVELNIGHFLIGEAIFDGLGAAVRRMRAAMDRGRAQHESRS